MIRFIVVPDSVMIAGLDLPQDALPVTNIFPGMEKPNSVTITFILQRQPVAMDRCVYVRKMVVLLVLVKTTAPTANHSAAHVIKQKSSLSIFLLATITQNNT